MRILIAEDDPVSNKILETMLANLGYEVMVTIDGNQAYEKLCEPDAPRLAILDWMMPGMDGVEVCRKIRETETQARTYIILLTAKGNKEDIVEGLEGGADDYIIKPFNKDELRARVEVGCRFIELEDALANQVKELQKALDHIETLQGIIPICSHCHKIRNDQESWERIDYYIEQHSKAKFSHSVCPECLDKYYPEVPDEEPATVESKE